MSRSLLELLSLSKDDEKRVIYIYSIETEDGGQSPNANAKTGGVVVANAEEANGGRGPPQRLGSRKGGRVPFGTAGTGEGRGGEGRGANPSTTTGRATSP